MNKNYKKIMDNEIKRITESGQKPGLLLHACCAPCSSAVLEALHKVFEITLFFYNPNISPQAEFDFRLKELKRLVDIMGLKSVSVVAPEYDGSEFEKIAKGKEHIAEGGERCKECYRLRIGKAVEFAEREGFEYVTTTLSISPHKNACWLNEIGQELCEDKTVKYLCSDFKKGEGYKRSCELSREYNLYRQSYCGCVYSKPSESL